MRTHESRPEAEPANVADRQTMPEKTRYTRYYEHDGMLRAYANRSMVLAMVFGAIALSSLAFAVYVRLQPPTVIRVDSEGDATVVAGTQVSGHSRGLNFVASAVEAAPKDVEAKAVVRRFLDRYLNLTPATVDRQMADALNMMTGNFKALVLGRLREDDTINKIQDDDIVTNFTIRTIAVVQGSPLTFTAFGVKEIHRLKNNQETTDQIVGRYNVRLALDRRTEYNPSGLLVADYWEQQMVGDKNTGLSQPDELSREATDKNQWRAERRTRERRFMINPTTNQARENVGLWALSKFGGLDQMDWLMILVSVLIGTIAKQHHFLQLPAGFLEWVFPFLLVTVGYKARGWITEIMKVRRTKTRSTPDE